MTKQDFLEKFEQFNHFNILIIGDVMIDTYLWGNVERISPEAPVPIVACTKMENRLGGAANVAINVHALGANPILCSVIGNDEKGKVFTELLKNYGLSTEGILANDDRKTTVKTRVISHSQHLLRIDEEIDKNISQEIENEFISHITTIISSTKINAIIFEDYDKGVITPNIIEQIVNLANANNIPTLVDPKKRNFLQYKNITLFKPNFKELNEGLKLELKKGDFEGLHKASNILKEKYDIKTVFVTLSELGVFISDNVQYFNIPAELREITDVSGAGDTVISTASVCMAAGMNLYDIAAISNMAGGLVCEKVGAVPINKKQLINEWIEKL